MNEQETRMLAVAGLSFEKGPDLLLSEEELRAEIEAQKEIFALHHAPDNKASGETDTTK